VLTGEAFTTPGAVTEEEDVDPEKVVASRGRNAVSDVVGVCRSLHKAWLRWGMIFWNRSHDGGCDGTKGGMGEAAEI